MHNKWQKQSTFHLLQNQRTMERDHFSDHRWRQRFEKYSSFWRPIFSIVDLVVAENVLSALEIPCIKAYAVATNSLTIDKSSVWNFIFKHIFFEHMAYNLIYFFRFLPKILTTLKIIINTKILNCWSRRTDNLHYLASHCN